MSAKPATTSETLPVPGQYSLRALFIGTLISAVVFAVLAPMVRGWPRDFQIHFVRVATVCIALPAALYALQTWRQRKLERECGELLAYLPGKSAKVASVFCITWYLMTFANWLLLLNLSASEGHEPPDAWNFVVLAALFNSGSLWAYGARGIHLRDRGLIFQSLRFDWQQINRFTWPNDRKLVLFMASRMVFDIPIPPGGRETIEKMLHTKTMRPMHQ